MSNSIWNIKLISSPPHSNLEIAGELVIKLCAPYSEDQVTVKVNPNIIEYRDGQNKNIRQFSVAKDTDETMTLQFDFKNNNVQEINVGNKNYEIRLMAIGKINEGWQDFPTFDFMITRL